MKSGSRFISLLVVVALLLTVLPVAAQAPTSEFSGPFRASRLIGYTVANSSGEDLARIEDLLVYLPGQSTDARVAYAIVGFGGFLGIGRSLVAVPVGALVADDARASLVLPIDDGETLSNAPTFEADALPDLNLSNWDDSLRTYWTGAGSSFENAFLPQSSDFGRPYQASELLDMDVVNEQGDGLGEVEDLILEFGADSRAGRSSGISISYAIVHYGGFLGIGESAVAVPLSAMRLDNENRRFVLPTTVEALGAAPRFQTSDLPGVVAPSWDADVRTYWQDLGYAMPTGPGGPSTALEAAEGGPYRAGQILGYPVISLAGETLGTVEDFLVDFYNTEAVTTSAPYLYNYGRVYYAVISLSSLAGTGSNLVVVPMGAMSLDQTRNAFVIEIGDTELASAPLFTAEDLPMPGQAEWDSSILSYWQGRGFQNLPSRSQLNLTETPSPEATTTVTSDATTQAQATSMPGATTTGTAVTPGTTTTATSQAQATSMPGATTTGTAVTPGTTATTQAQATSMPEATTTGTAVTPGTTATTQAQATSMPGATTTGTAVTPGTTATTQAQATSIPGATTTGTAVTPSTTTTTQAQATSMPEATTTGTAVTPGTAEAAAESGPYRVSQILGYSVLSLTGEDVGTVEDLLVDFFNTEIATTTTPYLYDFGRIYYAVVSLSGVAGTGPNMVIVPMGAMSIDPTRNAFVIDMADTDLASAPLFTAEQLPMPGQVEWDADILSYWQGRGFQNLPSRAQLGTTGTPSPEATVSTTPSATEQTTTTPMPGATTTGTPAPSADATTTGTPAASADATTTGTPAASADATTTGTAAPSADVTTTGTPAASADATTTGTAADDGPYRVSQILGYSVLSLTGEDVGTVEDLLVDFFNTEIATTTTPYLYDFGRVYYAVIRLSSLEGTGPDLVVVPMGALSLDPTTNAFVIDMAATDLAGAPLFTAERLPMPGQAQWDADILTYWQGRGFQSLPSRPQSDMTTTPSPEGTQTPAAGGTPVG